MRVKVQYMMSAYIEADTLEKCREIWENEPLDFEKQVADGYIGAEYDELLGAYNADTLEEIKF